jgi:hypothetical protein
MPGTMSSSTSLSAVPNLGSLWKGLMPVYLGDFSVTTDFKWLSSIASITSTHSHDRISASLCQTQSRDRAISCPRKPEIAMSTAARFNARRQDSGWAGQNRFVPCHTSGFVFFGLDLQNGFFRKYAQVVETTIPLERRIFITGGGHAPRTYHFVW